MYLLFMKSIVTGKARYVVLSTSVCTTQERQRTEKTARDVIMRVCARAKRTQAAIDYVAIPVVGNPPRNPDPTYTNLRVGIFKWG